jgi:hypothetical protein
MFTMFPSPCFPKEGKLYATANTTTFRGRSGDREGQG